MGISERERQALGSIEDRLAGSDPTLASMLAIFSRLTSGEEMPARERVRAPRQRALPSERPRWDPLLSARQRHLLLGWRPALLSLWLIVSAGLIVTALVLSTGGHDACTQFIGTVCGG